MPLGRPDKFGEIGMEPSDWKPVAVVTILGAGFAVFIAQGLRFVDCANEAWSVCSTRGLVQLVIALAGLILAFGMLVQSFRGRGHPGRWFWLTALVYAFWGLYLWQVGYEDPVR
jgi:hypothetical protein